MSDRIVVVPALYTGQADAQLRIDSMDGEEATIALYWEETELARGETFRRPQVGRYTWFDAPEQEICATFGAFLSHALESSEDGAQDGWPILTESANDWTHALAIYGDGF